MSETDNMVLDASDSPVILWGDSKEDVDYVGDLLTAIQEIGQRARTADGYTDGHAAFVANLRGQATMLGLAVPSSGDVVAALVAYLTQSRDHEGEVSEAMIATTRGKSQEEARQIRLAAAAHSGRRGWLDSTVYEILGGTKALDELKDWEDKQKK
jgi:hypothetical protein